VPAALPDLDGVSVEVFPGLGDGYVIALAIIFDRWSENVPPIIDLIDFVRRHTRRPKRTSRGALY
jgi:hypothetical protein